MRKYKGQSVLEYAVVVFVCVVALLSMLVYLKRGLQGGYRATASSIGGQYDPRQTVSNFTQVQTGSSITTYDSVSTDDVRTEITTIETPYAVTSRTGKEHVGPMSAGLE